MKLCETHWEMLRQAIKDRGMWDLVPRSAEDAQARMAENGVASPQNYDPLMDCNMMIFSAAIDLGGPYMMGANEAGGHHCPVCEVMANMSGKPREGDPEEKPVTAEEIEGEFINGPADAALEFARKMGLVSQVQ